MNEWGDPLIGQLIDGRYQVTAVIDAGGMATVYRAHAVRLNREVAVKVIHEHLANNPTFVARFDREARALARLNHPSVIQIYDLGTVAGRLYIAMELVDGETLKQIEAQVGRLSPHEALGMVEQILEGLHQAHQAGLIHRDIKPANLLVAPNGRIKIADFGIARALDEAGVTAKGAVVGTVAYMAPELLRNGTLTPAIDIYALGITLYEMLTGAQPYLGADPVEVLWRLEHETLPPVSTVVPVAPQVDALVAAMTAADPAARIPDAATATPQVQALAAALAPVGQDLHAWNALGSRVTEVRTARRPVPPTPTPATPPTPAVTPPTPSVTPPAPRVTPSNAAAALVADTPTPWAVPQSAETAVATRINPHAHVPEPTTTPDSPTEQIAAPNPITFRGPTKLAPSGPAFNPVDSPLVEPKRKRSIVVPVIAGLLATVLVGSIIWAVMVFWPGPEPEWMSQPADTAPTVTLPPVLPSETAAGHVEPIDDGDDIEPSDTPEPTVEQPVAPADNPLYITAEEDNGLTHYTWEDNDRTLRLGNNSQLAWTAGKQLPDVIYSAAGEIMLDFTQYPLETDQTIKIYGVTGNTDIWLPEGTNLTIKWSGAKGVMTLKDGLDKGKPWTYAEAKGSRKITEVEGGPRLTISLIDPVGNYIIGRDKYGV